MSNRKDNIHQHGNPSSPSSQAAQAARPSLFKTLEGVKRQVEFDSFGYWVRGRDGEYVRDRAGNLVTRFDPIYNELCLIIAETLIMDSDKAIKVAGEEMSAYVVQEVFGQLNNEHLSTVVYNFQRVPYMVRNKKAYLRSALYNAVFELSAAVTNDLARTIPGFFDKGGGTV